MGDLKIGEWIEVPQASARTVKPYSTNYKMAEIVGIRISIRPAAEGLYRLTRVS